MGKVDTDRRYKRGFFDKLAQHPAIAEIENWGMDDGRFFVHLKAPHAWAESHSSDPQRMQSFGSIGEARSELRRIVIMGG